MAHRQSRGLRIHVRHLLVGLFGPRGSGPFSEAASSVRKSRRFGSGENRQQHFYSGETGRQSMRKAVAAVFACCLLLSAAHVGLAQNTNSSDIRGTATDQSGAVLPGVTVTVLNNETGVIRTFVTNGDGLYDTNSILPGTYTVTFSKPGFEKLVKNSIVLQVGLATIDGALQVGAITQEGMV